MEFELVEKPAFLERGKYTEITAAAVANPHKAVSFAIPSSWKTPTNIAGRLQFSRLNRVHGGKFKSRLVGGKVIIWFTPDGPPNGNGAKS